MSDPKHPIIASVTASLADDPAARSDASAGRVLSLILLWAPDEPHRMGEVAFLGPLRGGRLGEEWILGRDDDGASNRVRFFRQRPGELEPTEPIRSQAVSAKQVSFARTAVGLTVKRIGKRRLYVNGVECEQGSLSPGDTLIVEGQLLLLCAWRDREMPPLRFFPSGLAGAFGELDGVHMIGESPAAWELRDQIAMAGKAKPPKHHVLVHGDSGTGKELVARAVHRLSDRAGKPLVSRSAPTIVPTLAELLLFGGRKNYPNPGTPETIGLIGEAEGGVLFIDEVGEVPHELHARLLRVLDPDGEYQRSGETFRRRADVRVIIATNRPLASLKFDLVPRLPLRVEVPPLEARREDIPLLVRHELLELARANPDIAGKFVDEVNGRKEPRMDVHFVDCLVRKRHPLNVRGLVETLWHALDKNKHRDVLKATKQMEEEAGRSGPTAAPAIGSSSDGTTGEGLTKETVLAALERNKWKLEPAAKELELRNRHALTRVMGRLGIEGRGK